MNTCSGNFYDTGGSGVNYANNENVTTTFCSTSSNCIQVAFSLFDLETCCDQLYIYDGPTSASPQVTGSPFSTNPGTITSTSGCLTFRFTSDSSVVRGGWEAAISCATCPSAPTGSCYSVGSIAYSADAYSGTLLNFPDDQFSAAINIGFPFCFYGNSYSSLVVSSNGYVSFNTSNAGGYSSYSTVAIPSTNTAILNSILGPWQDIDPSVGSGSDIRYQTLGTPPNRRFVVSFINIPMYSSTCNSMLFTGHIKIYETSNDIDIIIQNKPLCTSWNSGNAVEGIQDATGTDATVVAGRNNTNWTATNDARRFTSGCGPCSATLPIELLSFKANYNGKNVELKWETASETNNDFFTIEKSKAGIEFEEVTTIKGAGNSSFNRQYAAVDYEPIEGTSYYRLKQTDYDGKYAYSDMVAVHTENYIINDITVMPNPFTHNVDLVFNSKESGQSVLTIFDVAGHTVFSSEISATKGKNKINLNLSEFEKGIYILSLSTGFQNSKIKLIK